MCLQGARAAQEAILRGFPQADVSVSIVWTRMLPLDNRFTAQRQAGKIADARVRHFYDPHRRVARALGDSLGAPGKPWWDVYLFYAAGSEWHDQPPSPVRWAHQLSDTWADPAHCHRGDDLIEQLRVTMSELINS
jgi:hypothetical protein